MEQTNSDINNFCVIGLSYQKADAQTRGKFSFFPHMVKSFTHQLKENGIDYFFVLSTCNRTEIYCLSNNTDTVVREYCKAINLPESEFNKYRFIYQSEQAVQHFFKVSAGLDSQIIGDFEVVMQIKIWAKKFKKHNTLNAFLERLINTSIQISKKIKSDTLISSGITSVSYAAVRFILDHPNHHSNQKILLYGIGKIGRNTCENLVKHTDNKNITLINRTKDKAIDLSNKLQVNVKNLHHLKQSIAESDILVVATGAQQPTIKKEMIPNNKNLLILDLSMPENVANNVRELPNVHVINVDELSQIINQTLDQRKADIPKAEQIITEYTVDFYEWLNNRIYAREINAFKEKLLFLQAHELRSLKKKSPEINGKETQLSNQLVQKLTNRFASYLIDNQPKAKESIALVNQIFQLDLESNICE